MSQSVFQDLTASSVYSRNRASDPTHLPRLEQVQELLTDKAALAHTHSQLHDALTLSPAITSLTGSLTAGQELNLELRLAANPGILSGADGVKLDFGTGLNQPARGNHAHANDHVIAIADPAQANGITVIVSADQKVKAQPVLSSDGGLVVDGTGIYVDFGTGNAQAARGNHTHAEATILAAGLLSATDKAKLDSLTVFAEHSYTDSLTVDFTGPTAGVVTASVRLSTGLIETASGIEVDFTAVATAGHTHALATTALAGLMSAEDKLRLDNMLEDHDPVDIYDGNLSVQASVVNQTLYLEVALATGSGMMMSENGLELEYGTDATHPARGDHSHANDHVLATADAATNTVTVTVSADQKVGASVRLSTNGGLLSDATGLYCDVGSGAYQVAAGNHTHALVTTAVDGLMSAADKVKLDAIGTPEQVLTFTATTSVNLVRTLNDVQATLLIGTGLTQGASAVEVDFTQVAAYAHTHTVASDVANGFMSAADKTLLDSLPTQAENDLRYPLFSTGDPTETQYIETKLRTPELIVGAAGTASFSLSSSVIYCNPDLRIARYLYLPGVSYGMLMVDAITGLVRVPGADESFRIKDGNVQLWDDVTGKYHSVLWHGGQIVQGAGED